MTETNLESSMTDVDSNVLLSESSSTSILPSSSSSPTNTVDEETKRRKLLSKLWGKGNKSSHKVRELEKVTMNNSSDSLTHNDNDQQVADTSNNLSSHPATNDSKSSTEDNSNSINSSKPLAVVKPIVVVKSGLIVSSAVDRTLVNSETSLLTLNQIDQTETTSTVTERHSTISTTEENSNKKKKHHKNDDSKKKKTSERDRSHRHQTDENSSNNKNSSSSSKDHRREQKAEINNDHHKSSRHHSSSTSNNRRRSSSRDADVKDRKSNRPTTSRKEESSSSKKSISSSHNHHSKTSPHHRRNSSITLSPSPSQSRHSITTTTTTTTTDRVTTKNSSSPKKNDRSSTSSKPNRQTTESISSSKSTNSISPSDARNKKHNSETTNDKTRKNDENIPKSSESEKHSSSNKPEKSKSISENDSHRRKTPPRSRHDRHRSRSHETKTDRKPVEPSSSNDSSLNKTKTNHEKDSISNNDINNHDKKSSRGSSIPSTHDDHRGRRRRRSSDYHRHDSPSRYDRRSDHHHRHRSPHYSNTHYVHHHHHHHYRSPSSRYRHHHYHHRRSSSPHSHQHRSRYFSSTSSSVSYSPRRRSRSRTSYSSTRSSSSYSSISRTSSSSTTTRSSSRNNHYYHHHHDHDKKFRRSPTLEKLFLKASESIEAVSTQKNPNLPLPSSSSTTHYLPMPPTSTTSDLPITSLSEPNTFYPETFTGFSAPPPPFSLLPQQRCLKEITTDLSTTRRTVFTEMQTIPASSTFDEVISGKTLQSSDSSINVRPPSSKPPRVSRFSDITSTTPSEPVLNTNIPVDTTLNYTQISENINCLPSSRRQQKRHNREVMECECTTSEYDRSRGIKACGSDCLNRMLLIECGPMCPCGQWCSNRRFQRHSFASHKLALFKTDMKGYGLRTISTIRKGRFLVEYVGEVIDMDELTKRNKKYKRDGNIHQYVMSLIHGTVIDSTIKGNWARFINHSCEPNCVAEKWLVNGEYRMGIFAKRDLDSNEEITIDYRFESSNSADLANEKCYCGAPTCRGTISIKTNNNNNLIKRQNRRQPLDDDELLDYLRDDDTNEYIIPKTVEEIRQLIQIMSRTDSENVRTIELDLIKTGSQKHLELPRLFLECNGLHVLCSWMKDILIDDGDNVDEQQQYSDEFKYHLLDFIHTVLPIKDRTIVIKNGLFDLIAKKLKLPSINIDQMNMTDDEQVNSLMNSILDHLENPITAKLFHIYSTWASLKERFVIPKRKEPESNSDHHHHHRHHHHHHHSSKHRHEEPSSRLNFTTNSSYSQQKSHDRSFSRRSYVVRETPRTLEQQLSKDERRKLFEQQYEDEEKAKAAAAAAAANGESPGTQNEPPHKKQRTSDNAESMTPHTPPQPESSSTTYANQMDQTYCIHQHLSQIPIEYIRSYMNSIGMKENSVSTTSVDKDEQPHPPPPAQPEDETELSRIIRLPSGWSVAMCPTDSSVYFYNRQTMTTSWTPPSTETSIDITAPPLDLSPLSSAHINKQHRPHHHHPHLSSLHPNMKLLKHPHRHSRSHRHHHISSSSSSNSNKRKRPSAVDSTTSIKEEIEDTSKMTPNETIKHEEINDNNKLLEQDEEMSVSTSKLHSEENNEIDESTMIKDSLTEIKDNIDESDNNHNTLLSSSSKINRDHLRKKISQHVHTTLKPYTKRTCKQGRIVSTDDMKYLVKKFTLSVLDKEIEKAKNEGIPLSPLLTDRVRLKTEVYVKKYMNKMGPVFQRHDASVSHSHSSVAATLPPPDSEADASLQVTTSNLE